MSFISPRFLAASASRSEAEVVLFGAPFDGTSTFRPGSRFGPGALRFWSEVLETYSPSLDLDLSELRLADAGDLELPVAGWLDAARAIRGAVADIARSGAVPVMLGGEHLVTLAAVEALLPLYPDLVVLHLDAHLDLRASYQGVELSHATVMRRVMDLVGPERLAQWGPRSGSREEWLLARGERTLVSGPDEMVRRAGNSPVYLSLDLDVLDPSVMPDTGTPEPGGLTFRELESCLSLFRGLFIAGADVVEYCPVSGSASSGSAAAKCVREVLLLCGEGAKVRNRQGR